MTMQALRIGRAAAQPSAAFGRLGSVGRLVGKSVQLQREGVLLLSEMGLDDAGILAETGLSRVALKRLRASPPPLVRSSAEDIDS